MSSSTDKAISRMQKLGAAHLTAMGAALAAAVGNTPADGPTRKSGRRPTFLPRRGRLLEIVRLLFSGHGNREISRQSGAHTTTIAKVRRFQEAFIGMAIPCQCGRPATHGGWCAARYKRSERRQAFIERWASRKPGDATPASEHQKRVDT